MRRRLALLFAVLVVGALLLEGVARLLCRTDEARRERLLDGDAYWIDRWFAARAARATGLEAPTTPMNGGEAAILAPGDPLHRRDPRLGWVPSPGLRRDGLTTSSLGLRGGAEVQFEKKPGERRLVVVGDSFTFGEGVRDEEVWTDRLAKKLEQEQRGITLINCAVMGYGLDQQALRLEELGMKFSPDLVVVGLFGPDLDRNELTFRDDAKPRFVCDGDGLELVNVPVPTEEALLATLGRPSVVSYAWAMASKGMARLRERSPSAPKWELARRILDRMRATAVRGGARLVVAYFPAKPGSFSRNADRHETVVVEWARARGVPLVNVRDAFVALGSNRFFDVWHGHWTPFGNEVVAETIHHRLAELGLLDRR